MSRSITYSVEYVNGITDLVTTRPVDLLAFELSTGKKFNAVGKDWEPGIEDEFRLAWMASTHSPKYPPNLPPVASMDQLIASEGFGEWALGLANIEATDGPAEPDPTHAGA